MSEIWVELLDSDDYAACEKIHLLEWGDEICDVEVKWETAFDDVTQQTPPSSRNWMLGYPRHNHTEFEIDNAVVHIDNLDSIMSGPGRGCNHHRPIPYDIF
jgi:hypothetical protein